MITIDYLILAIVLVSMMVGFFRGFFPELISIATWLLAIFAAWQFSGLVQGYLDGKLYTPVLELWAARLIVFVITLVVGGLVGQLVSLMIDKSGLSGTDRMLGMVFGIVRGGVILGVLVILGQTLGFKEDPWWSESKLVPIGERFAETLRVVVPDSVGEMLKNALGDAPGAAVDTMPESTPAEPETP